ncbi:MAG: hybrid sensor histidine kinase/response regulator [Methylococcales bacterium]|nr:hybrid sensor histidine kinase/response regulator [Methylococcaceae bacterium]
MMTPLTENQILLEQIRLMQGNASGSRLGISIFSLFLVWAYFDQGNTTLLLSWSGLVMLGNFYSWRRAGRILALDVSSVSIAHVKYLSLSLIAYYTCYGALWGVFPWIAQVKDTSVGIMLILTYLAGMAGGAVALMSPVLPAYFGFAGMLLTSMTIKLYSMGPDYYNICGSAVLFLILLAIQAKNSSQAAKIAIKVKFENMDLMSKLLVETENAQAARLDAEHANHTKSKFLAAASHDLRQPIYALGLFLEVLSRSSLSEDQRDVLVSAQASSDASADMLNTLLNFSRIEAGVIQPNIQPFRLQHLINKIENELSPQAEAKGIVYRSHETQFSVNSDIALVELIFRNLVSNAIRYTEQGGILVGCRKRGRQVILEVWDTGVGIEPNQHQEIFREFHQLGNPERDHRKGLGLGLAIVEGLTRTLGHNLLLGSTPDKGSVFKLALPIAHSAIIHEELNSVPIRVQLKGVNVLVIDDDESVRAGMLLLLSEWGCLCQAAQSIEEALAMASVQKPDLIISDYRLREQASGLTAIATLRTALGSSLPALLITGDTAPDRLREATRSGLPLLHKPVSPSELFRHIVFAIDKAI